MNTQRAVATRPAQTAIDGEITPPSLVAITPKEQLEVIRKSIAPGIPDVELEYFLQVARRNDLDPFTVPPQIWAIPRKVKVKDERGNESEVRKYVPTMGIDGWRVIAQRTGRVLDSVIEWCGPDGEWRDVWLDDTKQPAAARATVYVRGWERPQRFVCRFKDFASYYQGSLTGKWRDMPAHMIGIRALSHCLKEVLRGVGGAQLTGVELGEWEPQTDGAEFEPERVAQRRFWATVDDLGIDDATLRRSLQVPDGGSVSETVDRMGGWGKALSYVEARAPGLVALPPGASASDLLYRQDDDPVAVRREQADQALQHFAPPAEPPATREARASVALDHGDRETVVVPPKPPPEPAPDDAYLGICSVEGCRLTATGYAPDGEGVLCEVHLRGEEAATESEPDGMPPLPEGLRTAGEFLEAVRQAFDLLPSHVEGELGPDWRKAKAEQYPAFWRRLWLASGEGS